MASSPLPTVHLKKQWITPAQARALPITTQAKGRLSNKFYARLSLLQRGAVARAPALARALPITTQAKGRLSNMFYCLDHPKIITCVCVCVYVCVCVSKHSAWRVVGSSNAVQAVQVAWRLHSAAMAPGVLMRVSRGRQQTGRRGRRSVRRQRRCRRGRRGRTGRTARSPMEPEQAHTHAPTVVEHCQKFGVHICLAHLGCM